MNYACLVEKLNLSTFFLESGRYELTNRHHSKEYLQTRSEH